MKICCTGNGITKWILLEEIEKIWTWTTTYMKDCYCLFCKQNFLQIIYKEYTWYFQPLVFFLLSRSSFFNDFWLKLYAKGLSTYYIGPIGRRKGCLLTLGAIRYIDLPFGLKPHLRISISKFPLLFPYKPRQLFTYEN